jgi:hypothetical protein
VEGGRQIRRHCGILQQGAAITSAGGYLRELRRKAQVNEFSIGPMLMALIGVTPGFTLSGTHREQLGDPTGLRPSFRSRAGQGTGSVDKTVGPTPMTPFRAETGAVRRCGAHEKPVVRA